MSEAGFIFSEDKSPFYRPHERPQFLWQELSGAVLALHLSDVEQRSIVGFAQADIGNARVPADRNRARMVCDLSHFISIALPESPDLTQRWLRSPKESAPFRGRSPLDTMVQDGEPGLTAVWHDISRAAGGAGGIDPVDQDRMRLGLVRFGRRNAPGRHARPVV